MFSKFRKNKCRKVLQFSVSQEFANRFLVLQVSQGFCNGQFADGQFLLQTLAVNLHWSYSRQHHPSIKTHPAGVWSVIIGFIAVLQSRSALCTVCQRNTGVLNLRKLTFLHLLKLQEPSVCFNLASLSQKWLLNTTRNLWHREHVGQLALSMVSPKDGRGHYGWFN